MVIGNPAVMQKAVTKEVWKFQNLNWHQKIEARDAAMVEYFVRSSQGEQSRAVILAVNAARPIVKEIRGVEAYVKSLSSSQRRNQSAIPKQSREELDQLEATLPDLAVEKIKILVQGMERLEFARLVRQFMPDQAEHFEKYSATLKEDIAGVGLKDSTVSERTAARRNSEVTVKAMKVIKRAVPAIVIWLLLAQQLLASLQ